MSASSGKASGTRLNSAIEFAPGVYRWDHVDVSVDRTAKPLLIHPRTPGTVTFTGLKTTDGVFHLGLTKTAKYITFDGFTFDGYALSACGIFEIVNTDHVTLSDMIFRNLSRDPQYGNPSQPYKSWAAYISGVNSHLTIDHWNIVGSGKTVHSGIQIDDEAHAATAHERSIHLTNISVSNCAYAFYENLPTTDLVLSGWSVTNTGMSTTSISFHLATGAYSDMHGTSSTPIVVGSSHMVSGGGNTGF